MITHTHPIAGNLPIKTLVARQWQQLCMLSYNTGMNIVANHAGFQMESPSTIYTSLVDRDSRQITFTWSPVSPNCHAVLYNIQASNCGSCPTTTNHTTVTCTDIPTDVDICMFAVQAIICGNIHRNFSDVIHIALKNNTQFNCNSNNIGRSVFTGAIVSATLLGGIIGACVTILSTITIQRKRKAQAHATTSKQESPDCQYEDVNLKQTSSVVIDTRKNVAYGHVAS